MKRFKLVSLVIAGVVLPVALVFGAYVIATSRLGIAGSVPPVPGLSSPNPSAIVGEGDDNRGPGGGDDEATPSSGPTADDNGGKCSEAEHVNDPECISGTDSSGSGSGDSSGSGGSGDDSSKSGSSGSSDGSGSDNSGKGGGDD